MSILSIELAKELLTRYGSPLYVYDGDRLRRTLQRIGRSIPYPRTRFRFASVTNGNIALLQIIRSTGWGLHANTPGDIYLGLRAGFSPEEIVYSGSNLDRAEMNRVLDWGVQTLNLDSLAQLRSFCEVYGSFPESSDIHLGLRLNEPSLTGDSRIGVRPSEFPEAIAIAENAGLRIRGLHFYRGTGTNATRAFTDSIDPVLKIAESLPDFQYLDFGGGFGYPYQRGGIAFDWEEFGRELTERLRGKSIDLVIEPGRAAIAGCAVLLTRVVSVKWQGTRQIAGVDTTVANLSVPAVHGGYRQIVALNPSVSENFHPTDVCGNTTYSRDYLGRNCSLPELAIGDILAILDVGAYGYAMSSHFLHRPRPAEVLLEENRHRLIRTREDYRVLVANQIWQAENPAETSFKFEREELL